VENVELKVIILIQAIFLVQIVLASPANDKIQEAAYILAIGADTAKAELLLRNALDFSGASAREKLNANLYLAKITEIKHDTLRAAEHYAFLKNNSQNASLAYMAAEKEKLFGTTNVKVKIASGQFSFVQEKSYNPILQEARFLDCDMEGELYIAQRIVYKCPNNSLYLVSKKRGTEITVPLTDNLTKVFLILDGFFLYCENSLYFYRFEDGLDLVWRIPSIEVQDIEDFDGKIYVLDISGKISLLNKNSGQLVSHVRSDGEKFFKPGIGLVGTYQRNGGISVFDTLLTSLWNYQIDGEIAEEPVIKSDSVIFSLQNGNSEILYTRHYQKIAAPTSNNIDSLLTFESGNVLAWYGIAEQKNSDSAWKRAVVYGARKPEYSSFIFTRYAEKIGAKWVRHLSISPNMFYPKMFSDANWLFVYDAEAQSLLKFSLETGSTGGEISLPKDRKYIVADNESPWLILNSGFWLLQFSLREQKSVSLEMPGMPFSFLHSKDSVYVGLWNGFALKYYAPSMRLEWSAKVSSAPVLLSRGKMGVYSLSQGKIALLSPKVPAIREFNPNLSGATYFKSKNGLFAIVSEKGDVQIFSEQDFKQLGAFSVHSPVISIELPEVGGKVYAIIGKADQTLSFYEIPSGTHIWTFESEGSMFMQPVLHGSNAWIDQDGSIVAIDISSGKIVKKYSIFGNGASISIHGSTLYCATPEKLLYAFPL
jgi:outer membrane protein assembly factor BamB